MGISEESLKGPSGRLSLQGVGVLDPNRCHHVSVDIVSPVQYLARGNPGLQPNRGCVLLYTTRHGDTMARQQEVALCGPPLYGLQTNIPHLNQMSTG